MPMPNFKIKILFITSLSLLLFSSKTSFTYALEEQSWAKQKAEEFAASLDKTYEGNINLEGYEYVNTSGKIYTLSCILAGYPCTLDPNRQGNATNNSLLSQSASLVSSLYAKPPASAGIWIADISRNIGFAPPTYAQGIGFSALSPLLNLWKIMRNISYALIIVVLLVIGLMIMFRAKIDPRTVISIQSALPRIVMTLILITFSYPIAGLMIDLMYLVLLLGISMVGPAFSGSTPSDIARFQADFANGGGLWRLYAAVPTGEVIGGFVTSILTSGLGITAILSGGAASSGTLLVILGVSLGATLIFLLIVIAFLFAIIRIFFILLNSYIQVLIAVIFAPILLLGQAIPGQSAFSNWIRNLLANLSVFPATAILLLVADIVSHQFVSNGGEDTLTNRHWLPPVIGGTGSFFAELMIPLGFALAIPQLVLTIKKAFGAKPIAPVGGSVARAFGQPVGIVQQTIGTLGSIRLLRGTGGRG